MEINPTRMCELLVGLPDVNVVGVVDLVDGSLEVMIEQRVDRPSCPSCAMSAVLKDRDEVVLADLPCFGRRARLRWRKHRWCCPSPGCEVRSWTGEDPRIAASRMALTDRAARWATAQVGRHGRSVSEVAHDLGCDWHTVNDAVIAYGGVLVEDPDRFGDVVAVGLDETLAVRRGRYRCQQWSTQIVDVEAGQLLDVLDGKDVNTCANLLSFHRAVGNW